MNIHKNARLTPQGQLLLVERVTQDGWSVAQAAQAAGLSTRQAYRWCARYRTGGMAALGDRYDDPLLVNIKPDIRDTFPHGPSPMHEARHRIIRRNPRYLHTVRRVAPSLGGHVV